MKELIIKNLPHSTLQKLFAALSGEGESRLVGGCVREMLAGNLPKDIDVASQVKPERMIALLENAGFKCIPTGIKHGTITALLEGHSIEITTLRSDISTDGRHATVEFTSDWEEDAKRRDFTINAMYMDLDGNIYDYFSGQEDLQNKIVRFVGDPAQRIQEDFLRILRYFRFCGYLHGITVDKTSFDACAMYKDKIDTLSGERIRDEFFKILSLKHAHQSLKMMLDAKVLEEILKHNVPTDILELSLTRDALANFIAILISTKHPESMLHLLLERLKLSNAQKRIVKDVIANFALYNYELLHDHKKMLYLYGFETYATFIKVAKTLGVQAHDALDEREAPVFPVKGRDLQKMYFEGKQIGDRISHLESIWMESDFTLTKEQLLKLL